MGKLAPNYLRMINLSRWLNSVKRADSPTDDPHDADDESNSNSGDTTRVNTPNATGGNYENGTLVVGASPVSQRGNGDCHGRHHLF